MHGCDESFRFPLINGKIPNSLYQAETNGSIKMVIMMVVMVLLMVVVIMVANDRGGYCGDNDINGCDERDNGNDHLNGGDDTDDDDGEEGDDDHADDVGS